MNRRELAQRISDKFYLRLSLSKEILDLICAEMGRELGKGERVYLRKLGSFHSITRRARRYYDIKSRKIKTRPAHKDVIFRPGRDLLRRIARGKRR